MRAGINILTIIIPVAIVLTVTIIAFAVYKAAYRRKINKRLAEGRDADIKPMMSPVKFIVITLLCSIVGLILLWGFLILIFTAHLKIDRLNLASVPSIRMMPNELLEDSVIGEYKFGDEIKGYTKHTFNDKDTCLEVYILNEEYTHVFAPVLVAAKYTGSKQVVFSDLRCEFKHNHFSANWDTVGENGLLAIDTGGYQGEFSLEYVLFNNYENEVKEHYADLRTGLKFNVNEYGQVNIAE
jgi:hypothetical protein